MLLPFNVFESDLIAEYDLQRLRDQLRRPIAPSSMATTHSDHSLPSRVQSPAAAFGGVCLMDVVYGEEEVERGGGPLRPFDEEALRPLASLVPGKLPGAMYNPLPLRELFAPSSVSVSATATSSTSSILPGKQTASTAQLQAPDSPSKRRRTATGAADHNVTIQHF